MKNSSYLIIVIAIVGFSISVACTEDLPNQHPTCVITSPVDGGRFLKGEAITISVDAADTDGDITDILFYIDDVEVGSSSSFPYAYEWNTDDEQMGSRDIKVSTIDNDDYYIFDLITIKLVADTITDIDGNIYNTVIIGEQEWMAENLNVTHFPNGAEIPFITDDTAWAELGNNNIDKAYCYNNIVNDQGYAYGALYTYAAAKDACPTGWHLPTDEEWNTLRSYIRNDGYSGLEGSTLKEKNNWHSAFNATDNYGFAAVQNGYRNESGSFESTYFSSNWWSSTESGNTIKSYELRDYVDAMFGWSYYRSSGLSVRCVID